jgi:hypothetical protein
MRTFCKPFLLALVIFLCSGGMQAQTSNTPLNQVELMKQFLGTWKGELGKDTIIIGENISFGNGLVCTSQIIAKGKILDSVKQLIGYDKKTDKFIIAELKESSPAIELCSTWFTSANTGEIIIFNPENVSLKFEFEFKTSDLIVQTALLDNLMVKQITLKRVKDK